MLEISALGFAPKLTLGGTVRLKIPKKGVALLIYLACANGEPIGRDRIADLLWPFQARDNAHHSLRNLLLDIRRAMGRPGCAFGPRPLRLDTLFDAVEFDVWRLEAAARSGDAAAVGALYRGPFLEDFEIVSETWNEWLGHTRDRLQLMAVETLDHAAAQALASHNPDCAIKLASRLLEIDPLHEPAHQYIIAAHRACGRDAAALCQYHQCARLLRRELDVEPSASTREAVTGLPITAGPKPRENAWPILIIAPGTSLRSECRRVGRESMKALAGEGGRKPTRRDFKEMAQLLLRVANTPAIDTQNQKRDAA